MATQEGAGKPNLDEKPTVPPGIDLPPGINVSSSAPASTSPPPGLLPPGSASRSENDPNSLAEAVTGLKVDEDAADTPDLSLKADGLRDSGNEIQEKTVDVYRSAKSFEDLELREDLIKGLYDEMRFEKPSRIQAKTLPMVLKPPYRSLIAQAQNGSGKTTCFVLAMLTRVDPDVNAPQALCVCPTRELVVQNLAVVRKMGKFTKITSCSTATYEDDGIGENDKIKQQIVVGTHGKMRRWLNRRNLGCEHILVLVLDEADNMLAKDGFATDSWRMIRDIRRKSPDMQLLLFSATFDQEVKNYSNAILKDSGQVNEVFVPKEELSLDVIKQYRVVVNSVREKYQILKEMIFPNSEKLGQTIIFVRTRDGARSLHQDLSKDGYKCTAIHGAMELLERDRVIQEFRSNVTRVLVSTDVLSRGFDVSDVTLVINYDPPVSMNNTPAFETYLHRIGRSGRFGRKGAAFNLISDQREARLVDEISQYFQHEIAEVSATDEEGFIQVLKDAGLTDG